MPPKKSLIEHLGTITDPRVNRTKDHELIDILVIAICALLCRAESFNEMEDFGNAKLAWFKTFLSLRNGIPSHDTFNRVFSALNPEEFLEAFLNWTQGLRRAVPQEIVAMDGKALRRALTAEKNPKYIVSAWAEDNGLVLGQLKVEEKSNEITALPQLLRVLELSGCIVTLDAMGCQTNIAKEIKEADADFLLALKGNQASVHREVKEFLDDAIAESKTWRPGGASANGAARVVTKKMVEKDHGRLETREYFQSGELSWFADRSKWEGLQSVGAVRSTREINGKIGTEWRYYLCSLPLDIERFARAVRGHWGIENKLHWILDVHFGEDQSRARTGYAAENLATLRRFAINLLKSEKTKKRGIRGKQNNASWDHAYLLKLLSI